MSGNEAFSTTKGDAVTAETQKTLRVARMSDVEQLASRCRSCGAAIRWATTEAGRLMPLDAQPSDQGNVAVAVLPGEKRVVGVAKVLTVDELVQARFAGAELWMPHHASCPQGRQWQRSQRRPR